MDTIKGKEGVINIENSSFQRSTLKGSQEPRVTKKKEGLGRQS